MYKYNHRIALCFQNFTISAFILVKKGVSFISVNNIVMHISAALHFVMLLERRRKQPRSYQFFKNNRDQKTMRFSKSLV